MPLNALKLDTSNPAHRASCSYQIYTVYKLDCWILFCHRHNWLCGYCLCQCLIMYGSDGDSAFPHISVRGLLSRASPSVSLVLWCGNHIDFVSVYKGIIQSRNYWFQQPGWDMSWAAGTNYSWGKGDWGLWVTHRKTGSFCFWEGSGTKSAA